MTDEINENFSLTNAANGQSDIINSAKPTMSQNDEKNSISIHEMTEIIKLKDQQITNLQLTIDQQSVQIKNQTVAIENMQKQMTKLSDDLSTLVNQPKMSATQKFAPIFMARNSKNKTSKTPAKKDTENSAFFSKSKTSHSCDNFQPSLPLPSAKRRRHLFDDDKIKNTNDKSTSGTNRPFSSVDPPADIPNDTTEINNDKDENQNNPVNESRNLSNDESMSDSNEDVLINQDQLSFKENKNFVNFKKNAIEKERNVTPIEISIKNNEKGSLHALLLKQFNNNSFLWSNVNKRSVRIHPFTQKVKDDLSQWLNKRNYQFHTFLNREDKPNAFIIRGLPDSITQSDIAIALQQADIQFKTIERHSTGYTRSHQLLSDLWRVTTPSCIKIQHFKAINGIMNVKIRVEVLKRSQVLQCKNCQLFFHSAAGCYRKYRCVKCDKDHPPNACPRDTDKNLPVACCNCHENHSANDLQHCPFFAKHIKPIIEKRTKERQSTNTINKFDNFHPAPIISSNSRSEIKPNVSFSSVVAKNFVPTNKSSASNDEKSSSNATKIEAADIKNLLIQNMQLMSAHQELMKKLSCLIE